MSGNDGDKGDTVRDPALAATQPNQAVTVENAASDNPLLGETSDLTPVSYDSGPELGATQALPPVTDADVAEVDFEVGVNIDAAPVTSPPASGATPPPSPLTEVPTPPDEPAAARPADPAPDSSVPHDVAASSDALVSGEASEEDTNAGKVLAMVAHAGNLVGLPLFIIPMLTRDNRFALFHAKQAAAGFIIFFVVSILTGVIASATCGVGAVLAFALPVPGLLGIYWALTGKYAQFPVIGKVVDDAMKSMTYKAKTPPQLPE